MPACANHPDRHGKWHCQRLDVAYCDECCRCPYPEGYCKFRRECTIWHLCGEEEGEPWEPSDAP